MALPLGAHFQTASATQTRVRPLNRLLTRLPEASRPLKPWSAARALSIDSPARQLWLSPMSPPLWAVSAVMPAPLRLVSVPGKLRPRPSSMPNSMNWSVGASQFSCTPSSPYWPPSIA